MATGKMKKPGVKIGFPLLFLLFAAGAYGQMEVIGERVDFSTLGPRGTLPMNLRFRVEGVGSPVPVAFSAVEAGRSPDPARPTLASRNYAVNPVTPYTVRMDCSLPAPAPSEICFNVYAHFPGTPLRSAILVNNACFGATVRNGTGQRIHLQPDLAVRIDSFSVDRTRDLQPGEGVTYPLNISFTIRNLGTSPTESMGSCWRFSFNLPRAEGAYRAGWNITAMGECTPLLGGSSQVITKVLIIPSGANIIRVEVDPTNRYREINETNNADERGISLLIPRGVEPLKPGIKK